VRNTQERGSASECTGICLSHFHPSIPPVRLTQNSRHNHKKYRLEWAWGEVAPCGITVKAKPPRVTSGKKEKNHAKKGRSSEKKSRASARSSSGLYAGAGGGSARKRKQQQQQQSDADAGQEWAKHASEMLMKVCWQRIGCEDGDPTKPIKRCVQCGKSSAATDPYRTFHADDCPVLALLESCPAGTPDDLSCPVPPVPVPVQPQTQTQPPRPSLVAAVGGAGAGLEIHQPPPPQQQQAQQQPAGLLPPPSYGRQWSMGAESLSGMSMISMPSPSPAHDGSLTHSIKSFLATPGRSASGSLDKAWTEHLMVEVTQAAGAGAGAGDSWLHEIVSTGSFIPDCTATGAGTCTGSQQQHHAKAKAEEGAE